MAKINMRLDKNPKMCIRDRFEPAAFRVGV